MKIPHGWRRIFGGRYLNEFDTAMVRRVHQRLWVICTRNRSDLMLETSWIEQQCYHTAGECFRALGLHEG